jgi:hypothetical protein
MDVVESAVRQEDSVTVAYDPALATRLARELLDDALVGKGDAPKAIRDRQAGEQLIAAEKELAATNFLAARFSQLLAEVERMLPVFKAAETWRAADKAHGAKWYGKLVDDLTPFKADQARVANLHGQFVRAIDAAIVKSEDK